MVYILGILVSIFRAGASFYLLQFVIRRHRRLRRSNTTTGLLAILFLAILLGGVFYARVARGNIIRLVQRALSIRGNLISTKFHLAFATATSVGTYALGPSQLPWIAQMIFLVVKISIWLSIQVFEALRVFYHVREKRPAEG
jgi:hypothetical protein